MQNKLFDFRQVLLFIGQYPSNCEDKVDQLINELGFSATVYIYGQNTITTKNLYTGNFEGGSQGEVLDMIKEKLYDRCKVLGIGMLDFFLIDATDAPMFKSIWHDGHY